jgi:hypothetical protein
MGLPPGVVVAHYTLREVPCQIKSGYLPKSSQLKLRAVEQRARNLADTQGVITDIDRGKALWNLLCETIERLRPIDGKPDQTPVWRLYAIAEGLYLQGKSTETLVVELNISARAFRRARRDALRALATVMAQLDSPIRIDT